MHIQKKMFGQEKEEFGRENAFSFFFYTIWSPGRQARKWKEMECHIPAQASQHIRRKVMDSSNRPWVSTRNHENAYLIGQEQNDLAISCLINIPVDGAQIWLPHHAIKINQDHSELCSGAFLLRCWKGERDLSCVIYSSAPARSPNTFFNCYTGKNLASCKTHK